jgi:hypothetical protein
MKIKWELSEPNLESAARKNAKEICGMHKCKNKLSDPPAWGYLGIKVCDEHGEHFDKLREVILEDVKNETDEIIIKRIQEAMEEGGRSQNHHSKP